MDIDGDTIIDLISGSYTGGISFFKGLGKGKFAAEAKLLPANKNYDEHELALSPCGGDWDGDGDADLAVGQISGPIRLMKNDGKGKFTTAGNFTSQGKEIEARDGGPCIVDWTGDGILDLLVGDDEGGVHLYPGKAKGSLELEAPKSLLPARNGRDGWTPVQRDPKAPSGLTAKQPGVRTKPFAADWNGDGKLDLLVGDFIQVAAVPKKLTATEKTRLDRLKKEMAGLEKTTSAMYEKAQAAALKEVGATGFENLKGDQLKKFQEAYMKHYQAQAKVLEPQLKRQNVLRVEIQKLEPSPEATGFVWVYLRK